MNTTRRATPRRAWVTRLLLIAGAWWALPASAEMLVQSLRGDAAQYQLVRGDAVLGLQPLSVLKAGDVVKVTGGDAAVSLVDENGSAIEVTARNSPLIVPATESRGWMDNAMAAALDWYRSATEEEAQAVSLVTRGKSAGPVRLLGMDLTDNLVAAGAAQLHFQWQGGKGPFLVAIEDSTGGLLVGTEVTEPAFIYQTAGLPPGDYLVRVKSLGDRPQQQDEQRFSVVAVTELPAEVRQLAERGLPEPLRSHLSAVLLAQYPEWRFASLQLSRAAGDRRLSDALLLGF